ncbi:MAG: hypothetical protein AMXMBFR58_02570 [Phycisphaerae bacterium]|nr:LysM peptidoglycan-binding domain-containing protein [Phycisphaerales bacterium]
MDQNPAMKLAAAVASLVAIWIAIYWLWEPASANRPPISFADEPAPVRPPGPTPEKPATTPDDQFRPAVINQSTQPSGTPVKTPLQADPTAAPPPTAADQDAKPGAKKPEPSRTTPRPAVIPPKFEEYKIQPGDDFQKIAARRYGSAAMWTVIARANPFVDPHRLKVGRVILLPVDPTNIQGRPEKTQPVIGEGWKVHKVRSGDTLSGISKQYYGTVALSRRIYEANTDRLKNQDDLKLGLEILIPPPPAEDKPQGDSAPASEAPR